MTASKVSEDLIKGVKHFEGFVPKIYTCPTGHPTIGYGHRVKTEESHKFKLLTEEQADSILRADLQYAVQDALRILPGLANSQQQLDAMASWVFNLGAKNLQNSTLKKLYVAGHIDEAAEQLTHWVYGKVKGMPVVLPGLVARREWERKVFIYGVYTL